MLKAVFSLAFATFLRQEAFAAPSYSDAIAVDGDTIHVSEAAAYHIKGEGLASILMQAAATPVLRKGEQIGYRLTDIDPNSVFEAVGLTNGDLVLEIDGMPLSDPRRSVEVLRYAKGLDVFTVKLVRGKAVHTFSVVIGQ